jgi:hypothetical protein
MNLGGSSAPIVWPGGKKFAFSIFDDTDLMTVENGRPVYDAFGRLGMRITKSVWPVAPAGPQRVGGSTCADPEYLDWVLSLQAAGHEIGYHNASDHPSTRHETIAALDRFEELFGAAPRIGADHAGNREAMYWGPKRLSGAWSPTYDLVQRAMRPDRPRFSGEEPTSEYFWGDVCRDRIEYWRNFCFDEIDLTRVGAVMPYHDPRRPYVNYWFTSTDASNPTRFFRYFDDEHLDALEGNGGVCIMYTHLGVGMAPGGRLDPRFEPALERLASRSVWVAPASEILDHLRAAGGSSIITGVQRARLEAAWIADRVRDSNLLRRRRRSA